ncbi:MAG: hypothetical protein IH892_11045 [Planctomycetes bacterium]|nr:hypothetical protein [Planctomycetota bacterium]
MKVNKSEEYKALRQEIIHWQTRRLTLLAGSVVFVTAVLSFLPDATSNVVVGRTIVVIMYLVAVVWLARYCALAEENIGAYIQVFIEDESGAMWETRFSQLKGGANPILNNLNIFVAFSYGGLGLLAVVWPLSETDAHPALLATLSVVFFFFFVYSLCKLMDTRVRRAQLLSDWKAVQEKELKTARDT